MEISVTRFQTMQSRNGYGVVRELVGSWVVGRDVHEALSSKLWNGQE